MRDQFIFSSGKERLEDSYDLCIALIFLRMNYSFVPFYFQRISCRKHADETMAVNDLLGFRSHELDIPFDCLDYCQIDLLFPLLNLIGMIYRPSIRIEVVQKFYRFVMFT
jgi:hypothetical protein